MSGPASAPDFRAIEAQILAGMFRDVRRLYAALEKINANPSLLDGLDPVVVEAARTAYATVARLTEEALTRGVIPADYAARKVAELRTLHERFMAATGAWIDAQGNKPRRG